VDQQLLALIDLQALDTRIAALEAEAARLPKQIDAIHAALAETKKALETLRVKADTAKKDLRTKEKDLEFITSKRTKAEARLWEVKNNTEYSAVLAEIEAIKQEKAKVEEEILALMELQEHLVADIRDTETQFKRREAEARQEELVVGRSSRRSRKSWPACAASASHAPASSRGRSSATTRGSSGRAGVSPSPP